MYFLTATSFLCNVMGHLQHQIPVMWIASRGWNDNCFNQSCYTIHWIFYFYVCHQILWASVMQLIKLLLYEVLDVWDLVSVFLPEHSLFVRGCLFGKPVFKVSFVVESYLGFSILKSGGAWISIFHRGKSCAISNQGLPRLKNDFLSQNM